MSARPLLNRAYIIIGVAAILMLATLLGGLALQRQHSPSTNASPAASSRSSSGNSGQRP